MVDLHDMLRTQNVSQAFFAKKATKSAAVVLVWPGFNYHRAIYSCRPDIHESIQTQPARAAAAIYLASCS